MHPRLQRSFDRLEQQKAALLSDVAIWPAERVCFRPNPAAWSALDVLDHLVKVEKAAFEFIQKQLPKGAPVTLKDQLGRLMVICVMKSPMRVKAPSSVAEAIQPAQASDQVAIAAEWQQTRTELYNLLQSIQPDQMRRGLFHHPVSGWMTLPQAMAFLSAHLGHHNYQLKRLKHASSALSSSQ